MAGPVWSKGMWHKIVAQQDQVRGDHALSADRWIGAQRSREPAASISTETASQSVKAYGVEFSDTRASAL